MSLQKRLPEEPRHAMDYPALLDMHRAIVALMRLQVAQGNGAVGEVLLAEGNVTIVLPAATAGTSLAAFAITTLSGGNFFVARQLSNFRLEAGVPTADVGAVDVKIAKTRLTRRSITTEKIDGIIVSYRDADTGDDDNNRFANDGGPDESQCVYPRYQTLADLGFTDSVPMDANCVIYAQKIGAACGVFDGATALAWLEEPGRVWSKRFA